MIPTRQTVIDTIREAAGNDLPLQSELRALAREVAREEIACALGPRGSIEARISQAVGRASSKISDELDSMSTGKVVGTREGAKPLVDFPNVIEEVYETDGDTVLLVMENMAIRFDRRFLRDLGRGGPKS